VLAAVALLALLTGPSASAAPLDRVREVVAITREMFLYPIPAAAYSRALAEARQAAGLRPAASPDFDAAMGALLAAHPSNSVATAAIRGFTEGLGDPYTTWLSPRDLATLEAEQSGRAFTGIGVEVGPDPAGLRVVAALTGSPARAVGLRPGDRILAVDGRSLAGLGLYRAGDTLLGAVGSTVTLRLADRTVTVRRAQLRIPPVEGRLLEGEVGLIKISIFGPETAEEARSVIVALAHRGARKWIIDLRDNPGGTLQTALDTAAIFLPGHVLVRVQKRGGGEEARRAAGAPAIATAPTAVLIDRGTASSAEVLSGALSDYHAAVLVGERSFGKGVIQTEVPLHGGGALKLTTARYRTPSGRVIQGRGLSPDIASAADRALARALDWIRLEKHETAR
jgi:carboxyl-terminal processing protease